MVKYYGRKSYRKSYSNSKYSKKQGKRRTIKRLAGEKPSVMDRIANYAGPIGKIAKTVAGIVQMINPEKKYRDAYQNFTQNISTASNPVLLLTGIIQGTGATQRTGESVKGIQLQIRNQFVMGSANTTQTNLKYWIVLDKEYSGSAPVLTDILETASLTSFNNLENSKRYVILKSRTVNLCNNGNRNVSFTDIIPVDFHMHYNNTTGSTVADCKENQIYIMYLSDDGTSANVPTVNTISSRFTFYDN